MLLLDGAAAGKNNCPRLSGDAQRITGSTISPLRDRLSGPILPFELLYDSYA